jgi:hypothetical protein
MAQPEICEGPYLRIFTKFAEGLGRDRAVANSHRPDSIRECQPVGAIIVAHQIGRCRAPRECLHDLLRQPLRRRVPGYREPEQLSSTVPQHEKRK